MAALAGNGPPSVPSCTPELVYALIPGDLDASASGSAWTPNFEIYADDALVASGGATIAWSARAAIDGSELSVGAVPRLGGGLTLDVTTDEGHHLTFDATCMAGVGAWSTGMILYANGTTRGWPGNPNGTSFVHFEAWDEGQASGVYVALVEGRDCRLDFATLAWTPWGSEAYGTGAFAGLPSRVRYSETDCYARFGDPKPRALAPGPNK